MRHPEQVAVDLLAFQRIDKWTVAQQAVEHEQMQEMDLLRVHAQGVIGVHVQGTQFHVADAPFQQGATRRLHRLRDLLGTHGAVVLVLDLQLVGVELAVLAVHLHPDPFPHRAGRARGTGETVHVVVQGVVAGLDPHPLLLAVLVADVTHAQGGGEGLVIGGVVEHQQVRLLVGEEGLAHRRRGAEEIGNQPAVTLQVAHQPHVVCVAEVAQFLVASEQRPVHGPEVVVKGEIEVHAGDHLHYPSIAVTESDAVDVLHASRIGIPVLGNGYALLSGEDAGHAGGPEDLPVQLLR